MSNKRTSEEKLSEYGFWRWQYQRRNKKYQDDYDDYSEHIKMHKPKKIKRILHFGETYFPISVDDEYWEITNKFVSDHGRLPKDYIDKKNTPGRLVYQIRAGIFTPQVDIGDVKFFEIMEKNFVTTLAERSFNYEKDPIAKIEMKIDTSETSDATLENIQREISYWYYYCQVWRTPEQAILDYEKGQLVSPQSPADIKKQLVLEKYKEAFFDVVHLYSKKEDSRFKSSNAARAYGLWIYDYMDKHGCSFKRASDKLIGICVSDKYPGNSKTPEESRLIKYYDATVKCIQDVEVYPMVPSKKP